jgi:hypothetical protein
MLSHVVATAPLALLLVVASPLRAAAEDGDHGGHEHHFVRISDGKLTPRELHMQGDEAVAWANYSTKNAVISFERDVGKHIVCTERSSFHLTETRLESRELRAKQFASMCQLAPGRYAYIVELRGPTRGVIPSKGLNGEIVVEEPE